MEVNQQKMREALMQVSLSCSACPRHNCKGCTRPFASFMPAVRKALSAPARQCDIGTDEEQVERYCRHCQTHCISCEHRHACNVCGERYRLRCFARWAQMPYEA